MRVSTHDRSKYSDEEHIVFERFSSHAWSPGLGHVEVIIPGSDAIVATEDIPHRQL